MKATTFNREKEVKELLKKHGLKDILNTLCAMGTPFHFCIAVSDDGKDTKYHHEYKSPGSMGIELSHNIFPDLVLISEKGFRTVLNSSLVTASSDALAVLDESGKASADFYRDLDYTQHPELSDGPEIDDYVEGEGKKTGSMPAAGEADCMDIIWGTPETEAGSASYKEIYQQIDEQHKAIRKGSGKFIEEKERARFGNWQE